MYSGWFTSHLYSCLADCRPLQDRRAAIGGLLLCSPSLTKINIYTTIAQKYSDRGDLLVEAGECVVELMEFVEQALSARLKPLAEITAPEALTCSWMARARAGYGRSAAPASTATVGPPTSSAPR
jgi:hypothetical protein